MRRYIMEKKYQVFISSTFSDLEDERRKIIDAVLECDCFPAGMEMFPALDMEQFTYIKSVIDKSDYYILVLAGRYGSLANDGISYTEKEYNYAIEKGIPALIFVKRDIETIPASKKETDPRRKEKLLSFRMRVAQNRLLSYWDEPYELKSKVLLSLHKTALEGSRAKRNSISSTSTEPNQSSLGIKQNVSKPKITMNYSSNNLNKRVTILYSNKKKSYNFTLSIIDIINKTGELLIGGSTKKQFEILLLKANGFTDAYAKSCKISNNSLEQILQILIDERIIVKKPNYEPVIFTAKSRNVFINSRE